MSISHDSYMATPPDMSGSVSKNRFRAELLWGVEKLLDCLDESIDNFAVVFDYRCDIELHLDDGYEFYQVKTSDAKNFGVSWVCKKGKNKSASIIAKLYDLYDAAGDGTVRLVVVGNKRFKRKDGMFESPGELLFSTLHEEDKRRVEAAITEFHPEAKPDLHKISYLLVAMDLAKPDDKVRGHLSRTYENVMGCEARKLNALYRALRGLASVKACEEKSQTSYEDVIVKKAVTSSELAQLFELYADKEDSLTDFVMEWIDDQPPLQQRKLRCAFEEVVKHLYKPRGRKPINAGLEIATQLDNTLSKGEVIQGIASGIVPVCDVEVTAEMRMIYAVIALYETIHEE